MDGYMKAAGAILVALILILALGKQSKDMAILLSVTVCAMAALVMAQYMTPVIEFVDTLSKQANLDGSILAPLLKAVGIGIIGEIGGTVCDDAGNSSMGKLLRMLSTAVILWLSLPLFQMLLELIQEIVGNL